MTNTTPTPGTECLVKHVSSGMVSSSTRYRAAKVTRVTKARVFARADYEGAPELEFRLDNLREYGKKTWQADELIVDPGTIAATLAALEVEKARRALEGTALVAIADLQALFEGRAVRNRSEAEIRAIVEFRNSLCTPAAENAGPG